MKASTLLLLSVLVMAATAQPMGGYGERPGAGGYGEPVHATPHNTVLQCAHAVRCTCEAPPPTCSPAV